MPPGCPVDLDGNPKWWGVGDQTASELEYLRKVIELTRAGYNIDERRIYIAGHSNGGHMVYQAANQMADVFAGAVAYAGAPFVAKYTPIRQVPFALIQGSADSVVNPSLTADYLEQLRLFNNASNSTVFTSIGAGDGVDRILYTPTSNGSDVLWIFIDGMGHLDWPSQDATFRPFLVPDKKGGIINFNTIVFDFLLSQVRP